MAQRPGLLGTPLAQFGLGALALVVGGALLFTLIGAVSDPDAPDDGSQPVATSTPSDDASDPGTGSPATEGTDAPTAASPEPGPTEATPTPSETTTDDAPVDTSITVQVLNGSDDTADQDAVVGCLESAGYGSLISGNRARTTYATTTVFYTAGEDNQAVAEQVARVLGTSNVEEQPGNLSEEVPVHVVTGQDGSDLC